MSYGFETQYYQSTIFHLFFVKIVQRIEYDVACCQKWKW